MKGTTLSANTTAPAARPGWRAWAGLAVLSLPTTLQALDVTVLYLALPHLSADLGATATERLWIIDVYGFMVAGLLVLMGTLGDRIGRRRLLVLGATAFGAYHDLAFRDPQRISPAAGREWARAPGVGGPALAVPGLAGLDGRHGVGDPVHLGDHVHDAVERVGELLRCHRGSPRYRSPGGR